MPVSRADYTAGRTTRGTLAPKTRRLFSKQPRISRFIVRNTIVESVRETRWRARERARPGGHVNETR